MRIVWRFFFFYYENSAFKGFELNRSVGPSNWHEISAAADGNML